MQICLYFSLFSVLKTYLKITYFGFQMMIDDIHQRSNRGRNMYNNSIGIFIQLRPKFSTCHGKMMQFLRNRLQKLVNKSNFEWFGLSGLCRLFEPKVHFILSEYN